MWVLNRVTVRISSMIDLLMISNFSTRLLTYLLSLTLSVFCITLLILHYHFYVRIRKRKGSGFNGNGNPLVINIKPSIKTVKKEIRSPLWRLIFRGHWQSILRRSQFILIPLQSVLNVSRWIRISHRNVK